MQVRTSRKQEPVDVEAFHIKIHDKEFLLQETADGLKVLLAENVGCILVRPQTGNSIIIVTRQKNNIE